MGSEILKPWFYLFFNWLGWAAQLTKSLDLTCNSFLQIDLYLLLYVDDMLIVARDLKNIINVKEQLLHAFEMKDLGKTTKILGMEISRGVEEVSHGG